MNSSLTPGVLILEDGQQFEGTLFGAKLTVDEIRKNQNGKDFGYGEVVFNTSMTGYQEILTDPSYFGQMVCLTYPHIGNTGINSDDHESKQIWCSGLIVHQACDEPSHWLSDESLHLFLARNQVPGIFGIDTRGLTRHLRSKGVIRGVLLPQDQRELAPSLFRELPSFEGRDLIKEVTTSKPYFWNRPKKVEFRVVAVDFGVKSNLLASLEHLGCEIEVVPATTSASEILSKNPDGIFLSNGPGDPSAAPYAVKTVRELLGKAPLFGVCMGHQILSLAVGGKTYKLKFGHRGGNQPVLDQVSGKVEISSHNHGYSVSAESLPPSVTISHMNLNDKTVEGIRIPEAKAFSVQYHPEACPGPHDSIRLFHQFIEMMRDNVSKIS